MITETPELQAKIEAIRAKADAAQQTLRDCQVELNDLFDGRPFVECPIHHWFELSRAQYLTIPRSILEAMPMEWKQRFADCLEQLDETIDWRPKEGRYWVRLKDGNGRYVHDELGEYRHPLPGTIKFFDKEKNNQ